MTTTALYRARRMVTRVTLGAGVLVSLVQVSAGGLAAQASKGVHVCLGSDNLLRFTTGERCPQGQRMFRLAEVEDEVGLAKERDDPPDAVIADLKAKIDLLSRRVGNLEMEASKAKAASDPKLPTQVKAPFEVVDGAGKPIFVVADAPQSSVARKGRFQIARSVSDDSYSMLVRNAGGKGVLGLGEISDGGALYIADAAGATRMFSSASDGLKLYGKADIPAVHLTAGRAGAGVFWLYDESGTPMVKAGTLTTGIGTVEVGPNNKCAPEGGLRIPDCIRGRR